MADLHRLLPTLRSAVATSLLLGLAAVPLLSAWSGQGFYVTFFARIMILGLAAIGLNLVLGFGGMVSLGHALYMGIGVYSVGILSEHGIHSGWLQLAVAVLVCIVTATLVGLVCLRTSGMAFIMITLAFAQMAFYIAVNLRSYGGDDGLAIGRRSDFGLFSLADNTTLYFTIYIALLAVLLVLHRLVHSRFGMVLRGSRANAIRMGAIGHPVLRYRLAAYVLSALICAVAGFFLANLASYMSPSYMQWQVSGELIVMAVLGGMGTVIGPLFGAAALLMLEELLGGMNLGLPFGLDAFVNKHLTVVVGIFIVLVALKLRNGLYGQLAARDAKPSTEAQPTAATSGSA